MVAFYLFDFVPAYKAVEIPTLLLSFCAKTIPCLFHFLSLVSKTSTFTILYPKKIIESNTLIEGVRLC